MLHERYSSYFYSTGSYDFYILAPVASVNLPVVLLGATCMKIKINNLYIYDNVLRIYKY